MFRLVEATILHKGRHTVFSSPGDLADAMALKDEIRRFLSLLEGDATGSIMLANLLDSCDEGLVPPDLARIFLEECSQTAAASPGKTGTAIFREVSQRKTPGSSPTPKFLRLAKRPATPADGTTLSNVVSAVSFIRYHVDKTRPSLGVALPSVPLDSSSRGVRQMDSFVRKVTARPNWFTSTASLGRPLPEASNCWLSTNAFPDSRKPLPYPAGSTEADKARDTLGLIDSRHTDQHLIRYMFDAARAWDIAGPHIARPTFADLGNDRFRVKHLSQRGRALASAGWGSTIDLGRLAHPKMPSTGRPERVVSALPLRDLTSLQVVYLQATTLARGSSSSDNDLAFARSILRGRKTATLCRKILRFVE